MTELTPRGKSVNAHTPHSPTPTALCPTARRYAGYEDGLPFNANGVVPKHRRFGLPCSGSVAIPKTNHHVAHSAGFVNPRSTIPELGHGTTPSGLFIWLAFTRGSAPAAQPRALWQNPVGIPGGGWGKARPSGFPEGKRRWPDLRRFRMGELVHVHPPQLQSLWDSRRDGGVLTTDKTGWEWMPDW